MVFTKKTLKIGVDMIMKTLFVILWVLALFVGVIATSPQVIFSAGTICGLAGLLFFLDLE